MVSSQGMEHRGVPCYALVDGSWGLEREIDVMHVTWPRGLRSTTRRATTSEDLVVEVEYRQASSMA